MTNRHARTVSVLLAGKSGFEDAQSYDVGRAPRWAAIGDLDGDRSPDLAVVNERDDTVSILLNKGDGTFKKKHDLRPATGRSSSASPISTATASRTSRPATRGRSTA